MRLPINQKNKNRKIMKLHVHTTLSFHHKPQCYEKIIMSGIEIIIFHAQTQLNMKLSFS